MRKIEEIFDIDCLILAVAHNEFKKINMEQIASLYKKVPMEERVLIDIKGIFDKTQAGLKCFRYWRL